MLWYPIGFPSPPTGPGGGSPFPGFTKVVFSGGGGGGGGGGGTGGSSSPAAELGPEAVLPSFRSGPSPVLDHGSPFGLPFSRVGSPVGRYPRVTQRPVHGPNFPFPFCCSTTSHSEGGGEEAGEVQSHPDISVI